MPPKRKIESQQTKIPVKKRVVQKPPTATTEASLPSISSFVSAPKTSQSVLAQLASKLGVPVQSVIQSGVSNIALPISQIVTLPAKQQKQSPLAPTSPTMTALLNKPIEMGPPAPVLECIKQEEQQKDKSVFQSPPSKLYGLIPVTATPSEDTLGGIIAKAHINQMAMRKDVQAHPKQ